MKWTVQQKIRLGFWLLALVPIILGILAAENAKHLADSTRHLAVTNEMSRRIEKLSSDIKDLEVAQREYILSSGASQQVLDDIMRAIAAIEEDRRELKNLRSRYRDPEQDQWMAHLENLIPENVEAIRSTIRTRDESGPDAASQELLTARGSRAIEGIRVAVRNMNDEEERLLRRRSQEQESRLYATSQLFAVVLLVNVALLVMLYFLQRRETERVNQINEELERRVAQRTEALQRSNEDLQQFAYIASHDLKEPLRMISSYATLLERRFAGRLDEDADTFIGFITDGARRMNALIQDLLEYSRAGAGPDEQPGDVDVHAVLRNVIANLKVTIAESGASVKWEGLPDTVPYDAMRLTQIFQNLIGNALKYRGDRKPDVRIRADRNGDEIIFKVTDNGIGIASEFQDKIFGIFQRLHGKEYEGTGIGLAMVKKIVERYGGRIWVESKLGEGSTFFFTVQTIAPEHAGEALTTTTT
ncbi:MAG TPA: ATP-binding protein [Bryobacteraceae bacterium]|nr:ATP-binding protein [Bryobacteraceae bacterium]